MNFRLITLILLFVLYLPIHAQYKLKLKDIDTSVAISHAAILFGESFTETNEEGACEIDIENNKQYLRITHLGYESFQGFYSFKKGENILYLKSKETILKETVIHGHKQFMDRTSVSTRLKSKDLKQNTSVNIGDLLTKTSGVSTIKTGGTIVKPVIQGMYGNRVVILNNGVVQQGQDWSAEHGTEIDPFIADKINVIKGAEGVKYGNGALGGVVLISPPKLSYYTDRLKGSIAGILASNGNASTTSGKIGSSALNNRFAWRVQGTKHLSADLKTSEYYLNNTGTNSLSFSGNLGYKVEKFGVEMFYSKYDNSYGLTPVAEVGNENDLLIRVKNGRPLQVLSPRYTINTPKQEVTHHLGKVNGFWKPWDEGIFKVQYSFQLNDRKEYFPRRAGLSKVPAFYTELTTHNILGNYQQKWDTWNTEIGVNYQNQINVNILGTKVDPTIPNFTNIGFGGYLIQKYILNPIEITAGIRYDFKTEDALGIRRSKFYGKKRAFSNGVFSLSGAYNDEYFSVISNFGMASRAPHVSELYSEGLKHGGLFYLIGDSNLKTETSFKWINNVTYHNDKWYIELSGFVQKLNNFIYDAPSSDTKLLWSGPHYVSNYKQADAFFKGIDANICYHFHSNFEYLIKGSLVHATILETNGYLPFIPSENVTHEVKFSKETGNSTFSDIYIGLEHRFVTKQKRFDVASELSINNNPIDTPRAYNLFNISAGFTSKKINNKQISFHISADNLMNNLYKEYTNRYRYFAHDLGRNINLKTIFNF